MEISVLVLSPKASMLSSQMDNIFWGGVSAAIE